MRTLFLMRHGQAEGSAPGGDPARRLTKDGARDVRAVGRALSRMGLVPDVIWHSNYVRAEETASIVAGELRVSSLVPRDDLVPHAPASRLADRLTEEAPGRLLVVSHLPLLPELVAELLGVPLRVDITPASLVHLTLLSSGRSRAPALLSGFFPGAQLSRLGEPV